MEILGLLFVFYCFFMCAKTYLEEEKIKIELENSNGSSFSRLKMKGMIVKDLPKYVDEARIPGDLNVTRMLLSVLRSGTKESLIEFHSKTLFLGAMHFQDLYNLDLERLQRCGIHYATPDGRIIPFCSYNILHRKDIEERFSLPVASVLQAEQFGSSESNSND